MATEIKTWQIIEGKLNVANSTLIEAKRKEKDDLEQWIKSNPEILGEDIAIIGQQVQTKSGPLDFLGIDFSGNLVIVELKRDRIPREALAQAIDYASDLATWEVSRLSEICQNYIGQTLEDYLGSKFQNIVIEDLVINQTQRLLLVGFSMDEPLIRMIEWLSSKFNVGINAVILNYIRTKGGEELLSRTVIIPEEVVREKSNQKKFIIEMSNEPGEYDKDKLKELLKNYLSKNLYSSQRIKEYLLPILLKKEVVTREQLKKEIVKLGVADERQVGYHLSLISSQLGHKWKDYLRQVVSYEFPNYHWEKDNFKIREGYKDLVKEVLEELKPNNPNTEIDK